MTLLGQLIDVVKGLRRHRPAPRRAPARARGVGVERSLQPRRQYPRLREWGQHRAPVGRPCRLDRPGVRQARAQPEPGGLEAVCGGYSLPGAVPGVAGARGLSREPSLWPARTLITPLHWRARRQIGRHPRPLGAVHHRSRAARPTFPRGCLPAQAPAFIRANPPRECNAPRAGFRSGLRLIGRNSGKEALARTSRN
jgi:hypothetical protein